MNRSARWAAAAAMLAALAPAAAQDYGRAQRRDAVVRAVERVGPAVVNISTETIVRNPYADAFRIDPFEFFFGQAPRRSRVQNSLGSGVIVDAEGYVLTNDHVIAAATKITVTLADGRQVDATVVGSDQASDLAVLKLKGKGPWPSVPMGSSDDLMIGETVIAIGNPFGLQNSVTTGVVSALGRTLSGPDDTPYSDFIQTDAAINPGNSGGALLDILGELVGINAQIVREAQNVGFAIPIDRARKVHRELVTYGRVRPAWTGLVLEDLDAADARELGLSEPRGVFVRKRFPGSPAEQADIRPGDLILAVNGQKTGNVADFDTAIARTSFGASVQVKVRRDDGDLQRTLAVRPFPKEQAPQLAWSLLGLQVRREGRNVLIERVREGSPADAVGLAPGLALEELNGREVTSVEDFYEAMPEAAYRRSANLIVRARDGYYRVTLPLTAKLQSGRGRN